MNIKSEGILLPLYLGTPTQPSALGSNIPSNGNTSWLSTPLIVYLMAPMLSLHNMSCFMI